MIVGAFLVYGVQTLVELAANKEHYPLFQEAGLRFSYSGKAFRDGTGGSYLVYGNTIARNGWNGIAISRAAQARIWNNVIAFNGAGVAVYQNATSVSILRNSIHSNGGLGINLDNAFANGVRESGAQVWWIDCASWGCRWRRRSSGRRCCR